jgi:hypothetical protein
MLGGILFVVWGYVDRPLLPAFPEAIVSILNGVVPALFMVGVVGILVLCGGRIGALCWPGMVLALYGSAFGVMGALVDGNPLYTYFAHWGLALLNAWLASMNSGLTLAGIASLGAWESKGLGTLILAIGLFGWGYDLTDSSFGLLVRSAHVGFGLLFSLAWVALGLRLWVGKGGQG